MRREFFCGKAAHWLWLGLLLTHCTSESSASPGEDMDATVAEPADAASPWANTEDEAATGAAVDARVAELADAGSDATVRLADASIVNVCETKAVETCPNPPVRYADVQPIFEQRCVVCHSPLWTGPWPLDAYGHVADWQDDIRSNLLNCSMPPADAGIPITIEERQQILSFLRCGLPQ